MNIDKIRLICRPFRIVLGLGLLSYAGYTYWEGNLNPFLLLGAVPLIAGLTNFCPLCIITKKCSIK